MRANEVHGGHLGRKVTIRGKDIKVESGTLQAVNHEADLIIDRPMFQEPYYVTGAAKVILKLVPDSIVVLRPQDIVEIID